MVKCKNSKWWRIQIFKFRFYENVATKSKILNIQHLKHFQIQTPAALKIG